MNRPSPGTRHLAARLLHPLEIEWDPDLRGGDPLGWPGYAESLSHLPPGDSVVTGRAVAAGARYVVIAGRFDVVGGSMGAVHGERVVRAYRRAALERLPVVVLASSGGARLQEGMVALAQMARTAAAARAHARAGLLSIAVLRAPTTGGVLASYASLTDLRAAEPGATIGFAGPRVVEVVTGAPLSASSHTGESAYAAGLVDALVPPDGQSAWVEAALGVRDQRLTVRPTPPDGGPISTGDGAWLEVQRARARARPTGVDHAARLCDSWVELRGTDPTLRAGLARIGPERLVVMANDRRAGTGRPGPAAYRLARRAIGLASRLRLPLLALVDMPGAEPGDRAEADGVAGEIAETFAAMAEAQGPTVAVCVGEGGSGGALALAAADRLLMLEHAVFSVIPPEGAAAILARDPSQAPRYAARLRLTAADVVALGVADAVVPEDDDSVSSAIAHALATAQLGDRLRRLDAATSRWAR
ncbi:MAG TPA: carboxyl transferase domain-containing protein [Acidimicrobiales bacterium]|nr:carboxyl transferase domain-containing protein [Acidimicrobiales bacterium]